MEKRKEERIVELLKNIDMALMEGVKTRAKIRKSMNQIWDLVTPPHK